METMQIIFVLSYPFDSWEFSKKGFFENQTFPIKLCFMNNGV